jgi:hypothetical protein
VTNRHVFFWRCSVSGGMLHILSEIWINRFVMYPGPTSSVQNYLYMFVTKLFNDHGARNRLDTDPELQSCSRLHAALIKPF